MHLIKEDKYVEQTIVDLKNVNNLPRPMQLDIL